MIFKRKIYSDLLNWKSEGGKTALLIEGARRVGKSTIVEEFAKQQYKSYVLIDFSIASDDVKSLFTNYASSLNDFFFFLSSLTGQKLFERETLIIFDEVQLFPAARQLIKHLVKDNRYDYIQTGSLLSLKQNVAEILLPSEERTIKMYPLDFEEFCWATGHNDLIPFLQKRFEERKPAKELHQLAMKLFRQYMLIGGMPQAVAMFLETNDYTRVDRAKRDILQLYRNDIRKYAKNNEYKVISIFDEIPNQLTKHEKKFTLSALSKDARFRDYEEAFVWLNEAMMTNPCFNASDPTVGLGLYRESLTLKMYMGDTGLLFSHAFNENEIMQTEVAQSIVAGKLNINSGMFLENIVAQMLVASNKRLYFYSRNDRKNAKNTMEIDFMISDPHNPRKISLVEVKSGKNYTTSSLKKMKVKFGNKLGQSYLLHTKDLRVHEGVIYLPVYMTIFL
ncbi:MAG TPA: AAA family ATPase [Bacilli bacterium]|mgnify:CR=1 FL=1|nr:AAA family ATPase [Bacilli bacterium]HOQ70421.1 AAA family ATPase [Bacilli bacterium]